MLVTDLERYFYNVLSENRILVLVHFDVDALCATKILQSLFRMDNILYTIVGVQTREKLKTAFQTHSKKIKNIILVNCGGTIDIIDFLRPEPDITFFIADNHRPLDVCNIYSEAQVKVLSPLRNDEKVPAFTDIFREDEDEEEEEDEMDESGNKGLRIDEEVLDKRRQRRLWEQKRKQLLFDYSQFSYVGSSTALVFYEMAWKLSKDSRELLWYALVGQTELFVTEKIGQDHYLLLTPSLHNHVARLVHLNPGEKPLDTIKISFAKELNLVFYRHWTLEKSMKHSPYFASTLKLWTLKGEKKMQELLAEMGIPLTEFKQFYSSMDMTLRNELQTLLESKAQKYNLPDLLYPSFTVSSGFRYKFSASDFVYAMSSLLENPEKQDCETDCFLEAWDCLQLSDFCALERGIQKSKLQFQAIWHRVTNFLMLNQVISAGTFLYATVMKGSDDSELFSCPYSLTLFAQFTLKAHVSAHRNSKSRALPLVLSVPDPRGILQGPRGTQISVDTCLICGIPPIGEDARNFFGKAFEQAAEQANAVSSEFPFFDSNIIRLSVSDRSKFFDSLLFILD